MDRSRETLLRVESNDPTLKVIRIDWRADTLIGGQIEGYIKFNANDVGDYTTLGASIARNTQLRVLNIFVCNTGHTDTAAASDFIDGLKQNTSINSLRLQCNDNIVAGNDINGILEAYRLNGNLTRLSIGYTGNIELYIPRVRGFTNLNYVSLHRCNISSEQLLSIVEAIRGHRLLEELHLVYNSIGNAGCGALASLLEDPNSNLRDLLLTRNNIGNEGAVLLANSLANNTKLQRLWLGKNPIDWTNAQNAFSKLLCNTSSMNGIHSSNHMLESLCAYREDFEREVVGVQLASLLELNMSTDNKSLVAIKKILKCYPNIDMEPHFKWGSEEPNLKSLPFVVAWFEKASEAVAEEDRGSDSIGARKLSAIYQFAQAMPLLFVTPRGASGNADTEEVCSGGGTVAEQH